MGAPIGPGDWVECVDAGPDAQGEAVPLVRGEVYRVLSVVEAPDASGKLGDALLLADVDEHSHLDYANRTLWLYAWSIERFRPIYRPKADLIESLKAPPQRVGEPA